jgi:hypothetical protein
LKSFKSLKMTDSKCVKRDRVEEGDVLSERDAQRWMLMWSTDEELSMFVAQYVDPVTGAGVAGGDRDSMWRSVCEGMDSLDGMFLRFVVECRARRQSPLRRRLLEWERLEASRERKAASKRAFLCILKMLNECEEVVARVWGAAGKVGDLSARYVRMQSMEEDAGEGGVDGQKRLDEAWACAGEMGFQEAELDGEVMPLLEDYPKKGAPTWGPVGAVRVRVSGVVYEFGAWWTTTFVPRFEAISISVFRDGGVTCDVRWEARVEDVGSLVGFDLACAASLVWEAVRATEERCGLPFEVALLIFDFAE